MSCTRYQSKKFIIGIDAVSISGGGGLTHLRELLTGIDLEVHDNIRVIVWGRVDFVMNYVITSIFLKS